MALIMLVILHLQGIDLSQSLIDLGLDLHWCYFFNFNKANGVI
jgi:hypothetical protein